MVGTSNQSVPEMAIDKMIPFWTIMFFSVARWTNTLAGSVQITFRDCEKTLRSTWERTWYNNNWVLNKQGGTHWIHVCHIWSHLPLINPMLVYIPYMDPMGYNQISRSMFGASQYFWTFSTGDCHNPCGDDPLRVYWSRFSKTLETWSPREKKKQQSTLW